MPYASPESIIMIILFFFFQAEDGIRDLYVTGVQTCALPIYAQKGDFHHPNTMIAKAMAGDKVVLEQEYYSVGGGFIEWKRSEERRVGKECRSRGSAYH